LVLLESFWAFGWLVAVIIAYLVIPVYSWNIAFFVGALPLFYAPVLLKKIPESPRFLERQGRTAEAEEIVSKMEKEAGLQPSPDPQVDQPEKTVKFPVSELFSRSYLRRTVFLWVLWFCIVFSYYGIFTWLPSLLALKQPSLLKSFSYVLIMTIAQIPGITALPSWWR